MMEVTRRMMALGAALALGTTGCATATRAAAAALVPTPVRSSTGAEVGSARVEPTASGARVVLEVRGMAPGTYGTHLHQVGRCDAPSFTSAGAHWNPTGRQHGTENPAGPHEGDLPNLVVGTDGTGRLEATVNGSIFDEDGTALMIHAAADDYRTDPAGNAGARMACAVLSGA